MSVDVFGRHISAKRGRGSDVRTISFKLTPDGNYDISGKRLCNVKPPERESDAATLHLLNETRRAIESRLGELERNLQHVQEQLDQSKNYSDRLVEDISKLEIKLLNFLSRHER